MTNDLSIYLTGALTLLFVYGVFIEKRAFEQNMFPFISFVSAYYLLFHGIFSMYVAVLGVQAPYETVTSLGGSIYVAAFCLVQLVVFHIALKVQGDGRWLLERLVPAERKQIARILAWLALTFALSFDLVPLLNVLPSIPQLKQPLWLFAVATLAYMFFDGRLSRVEVVAFAFAITLRTYFEFTTVLLTNTILMIVLFLSAAIYLRRFREAFGIALICVIAIMAYAYPKYFARVYLDDKAALSANVQPELDIDGFVSSVALLARRSSHALLTSHVMERTPATIPYSERSPIMDTITNHVPRVLWSDKPQENFGNSFGKSYGILLPADEITSWNIPWTADLYITGGATSALLRIAGIAAVVFLLSFWLSRFPDRAFSFGVHAATVFPLFHQSSNLSLMAGNIFIVTAIFVLGYWVMSKVVHRIR